MLSLDAIKTFCTIVETRNFRESAANLFRTQPAVTQQLKRLEAELGVVLFDRKLRRPTPEGQLLYKRGKRLLQEAEDIERELTDDAAQMTGHLFVGTSDTNALYFLPPKIAAFSREWPGVQLEVYSRSTDLIAGQVLDGHLDLGIVTLPLKRDDLETQTLFNQDLVLVVPTDHPLTSANAVALSDLSDETFVLLEETTRTGTLLRDCFNENGFTPRVSMHSGSFEVIKRYVVEGLGISFVPQIAVNDVDRKRLKEIPVAGLPSIGIGLIWQAGRYQNRAAKAFMAILQSNSAG